MLAVLQFDSPSLAVLDRMLDAGRLPALAGLRERGVWHELETPATHFAAGAFHTLYSGTELADHGLFYPFQWSAADQRVRYTTAVPRPAAGVGAAGRRALAMTLTRAARRSTPPSGTVVSGWQFTDRVVLQPWSSPRGAERTAGDAVRAARRRRGGVRPQLAARPAAPAPRPARLVGPSRGRRRRCCSPSRRTTSRGSRSAPGTSPGTSSSTCPSSTTPTPPTRPRARRRAGGDLPERRRRVRPRARRAARGHGRDRDVAGRHGRQHQPRGPAARDARRGARRAGRGPTRTPGPGSSGSCERRCRRGCGRGSRPRCPTGWRWP